MKLKSFLIILFVSSIFFAFAQTPITNTSFYKYYFDFKIVKTAEEEGKINDEIAEYLLSEKISIDLKAAIINAISFEILETNNAGVFMTYLKKKYNAEDTNAILSDSVSASDLFCLGYLSIMDDYFSPDPALNYLQRAIEKKPTDHAINIILNLVQAQKLFETKKCEAWKLFEKIQNKKNYTDLMLQKAEKEIFDFMRNYKSDCEVKK